MMQLPLPNQLFHSAIVICFVLTPTTTKGQIIPDATLPVNSTVNNSGSTLVINGGTQAGGNLFHSFERFDVPTGSEAAFNNANSVENIFTRVTGNSISNIDGILKANGSANLFLLNPNGIIFGPNATLNIGGSFVATTANALRFANGDTFSVPTTPLSSQLLNINPNALLFNQIAAQPIINRSTASDVGLQVPAGKNLLLAGGDIRLEGGRLQASGGIELVGVAATATVGLLVDGSNLRFSVPTEVSRADVSLSNGALVQAIAAPGGSITINAQNLNLTGGSGLLAGVSGIGSINSQAGNIEINANGTVNLDASRISNQVEQLSVGNTGNIKISTELLALKNGAFLSTLTSGQGNGGNVNIQARTISIDGVDSNGYSTFISGAVLEGAVGNAGNINISAESLSVTNGAFLSTATLGTGNGGILNLQANTVSFDGTGSNGYSTFASSAVNPTAVGNAGNINITTDSLSVANGAFLSTGTLGQGNGGSFNIQARTVSIDGVGSSNGSSSFVANAVLPGAIGNGGDINITADSLFVTNGAFISTSTFGDGNGGQITINANTLQALNGGEIETSTYGSGNGGNVTINVTDSITLAGSDRTYFERLATFGDLTIVGTPDSGLYSNTFENTIGQGGELRITTGKLFVQDGAQVNVSSQGIGNAGNIQITANTISLNNSASVQAKSRASSFGNITLNARDIILRRGSYISTNATGTATGGNITIDTSTLVAVENSDISANAEESFGGRVIINAKGIFGTEFRTQLTDESDITASSSLGASFGGVVQLNTPDVDPSSFVVALPETVTDLSNQITAGCAAQQGNNFVVTGRGGLPSNPTTTLRGTTLWSDLRPVSGVGDGKLGMEKGNSPIVEATGLVVDELGRVELVALKGSRYEGWGKVSGCGGV